MYTKINFHKGNNFGIEFKNSERWRFSVEIRVGME